MNCIPFALDRVSEICNKRHEVLQLLLIRVLMNPVEERNLQPVEVLSYRLICGKHEFLNNLLRNRALPLNNVHRFTGLVHDHLRFLEVEVYCPPPNPVTTQSQGQLLHVLEGLYQITVAFCNLRVFILQNFAYIGVGHPLFRTNHTRKDIMLHDLHLFVEFHLARQREPVYLRIQAADSVRQPVRKHRNNAVHQIDTASTVIGLLIQLGILPHIIANIGDMDP
ncbi:hypothetical protein D3C71_1310360 [compost metagenome]